MPTREEVERARLLPCCPKSERLAREVERLRAKLAAAEKEATKNRQETIVVEEARRCVHSCSMRHAVKDKEIGDLKNELDETGVEMEQLRAKLAEVVESDWKREWELEMTARAHAEAVLAEVEARLDAARKAYYDLIYASAPDSVKRLRAALDRPPPAGGGEK